MFIGIDAYQLQNWDYGMNHRFSHPQVTFNTLIMSPFAFIIKTALQLVQGHNRG